MPSPSTLLASLAACVLLAEAANSPAPDDVFQVDIVFPRNTTYAPSPRMPIVFALQNPELAALLNPSISFDVWSSAQTTKLNLGDIWYLSKENVSSSSPFLYHGYAHYHTEDHWVINWRLDWMSCAADANARGGVAVHSNSTGGRIEFTTSTQASRELDLVAALQDDDAGCPTSAARSPAGAAIAITGTLKNPAWDILMSPGTKCGVAAHDLLAPSPCAVTVDAAAATSIAAQVTAEVCLATDRPQGCLPVLSGAQPSAVVGAASFAAAVGGLVFFLGFF